MSMQLFSITWANVRYLIPLAGILIFSLVLIVMRVQKISLFVTQLVVSEWRAILLNNFSPHKVRVKSRLNFLGIFFLIVAILRPQWHKKEHRVEQEGRDLLVALDISASMLAQDIKPSRLVCSKEKIRNLLKELNAERVGLIIFSGSAIIHCPLTTDFGAFNLFLDQVDAQTIASSTTALDQAIGQALQLYGRMPNKKNKLLVIFTDGEDFSSNLARLKKEASQQGLHIFTVGVGTAQGAPIPDFDLKGSLVGYVRDEHGKIVISKLNTGILRTLAQDVGGTYVSVSENDADIKKIAQLISCFEKERFDDKKFSMYEEQYPWFVALSFICFVFEWLL